MLAWQDIRLLYRRSVLGHFWVTLAMFLQISAIALVFGLIFRTDIWGYLPYLAVGTVIWSLISSVMTEGPGIFVYSESLMKATDRSPLFYVTKAQIRILFIFIHNLAIVPIVFLATLTPINWNVLWLVITMPMVLVNLFWMSNLLAFFGTRFRDVGPIAQSASTVVFFLSPVMWRPEQLGDSIFAHFLLGLNPFYHFLQLIRLPLFGFSPTIENFLAGGLMAIFGIFITKLVVKKFSSRLIYWL